MRCHARFNNFITANKRFLWDQKFFLKLEKANRNTIFSYFYFMYLCILSTCMSIHDVGQCSQKLEQDVRSSVPGVADGCVLSCGSWD